MQKSLHFALFFEKIDCQTVGDDFNSPPRESFIAVGPLGRPHF
jgi:hypothetical protein